MQLKKLEISRFRNILQLSAEFNSRITVLVGENGQGKTSVLEAIYLLGHSHSFRTAKHHEIISYLPVDVAEQSITAVSGEIETKDGNKILSYLYEREKRKVFLNGDKISAAKDFYGTVKVIDFTPDDLFLVKGSPKERRRYLDKLLALTDKDYVDSLVRYQRALKNRNALLTGEPNPDRKLLSHWEESLIADGTIIAEKRNNLVQVLNEEAKGIYQSVTKTEKFTLSYESSFYKSTDKREQYNRTVKVDSRRGSTTFGIHRDDLKLEIDTGNGFKSAQEIASQGQTRSIALVLKLAAVKFLREDEEEPIVLLDDVESELDKNRRSQLLEYLLEERCQTFIATTDRGALPGVTEAAEFFSITAGKILRG